MKLGLIFLLLLSSCSLFNSKQEPDALKSYIALEKNDYIDQLASLAKIYITSPDIKLIKLSSKSRRYLKRIYQKIKEKNELLFKDGAETKFYVVKSKRPFHFSLPRGRFFFSSTLVKKFLNTEELLLAVLTFEMIKSDSFLYPPNIIVPKGYLETARILKLTHVSFEAKKQIDKLAFLAMKRAGHDPSSYLLWLQTQNKNPLEFGMLLRGRNISREEFSLKNFLVKEGNEGNNNIVGDRKSSSGYYQLIKEIEEKDS